MRRWMIAALLVLLSACGDSPPPNAAPPTAVPLAELDLEPLAIQSGDLPPGFSGSQVSDELPGMFKEKMTPTKFFDQGFQKSDEIAGGVRIMLYEDTAELSKAYDELSKIYDLAGDGMDDATKAADIGDATRVAARSSESLDVAEGIYKRCHALVFVRFIGTKDTGDVEAYLKRLDKRLQPVVCQP